MGFVKGGHSEAMMWCELSAEDSEASDYHIVIYYSIVISCH